MLMKSTEVGEQNIIQSGPTTAPVLNYVSVLRLQPPSSGAGTGGQSGNRTLAAFSQRQPGRGHQVVIAMALVRLPSPVPVLAAHGQRALAGLPGSGPERPPSELTTGAQVVEAVIRPLPPATSSKVLDEQKVPSSGVVPLYPALRSPAC